MAYRLMQFGAITLPLAEAEWDIGPGEAVDGLVELAGGGVFDAHRSDRAPVRYPRRLPYKCEIVEATRAALLAKQRALAGQIGVRERLWRQVESDSQYQWCWARLMDAPEPKKIRNAYWQPLTLEFVVEDGWNGGAYGGAWNLDDGHLFDNGLYLDDTGPYVLGSPTWTLANVGERLVTNAGITYTLAADGGTRTLKFTTQNCEWTLGPLAASAVAQIDCGAQTVYVNGVESYSLFNLTANHASPYWLEIASGGESLTVDGEYAGDQVVVTYSDGYY
jgi:hypothetical protein